MFIGTLHPSEARVLDSEEGYHPFHDPDGYEHGSFEVFWHDRGHMIEPDEGDDMPLDDWREPEPSGWYWIACFPGCIPDSETPSGPFSSSAEARKDADENWQD